MADIRWNDVRANFSEANQGIGNAIQGYSNVGTVFGQLRKSILDEEQRAWDNAFKEKEFQEKTRQFDEGHKLNIFKEMEAQRHNIAGEEHDKNVLEQTKVRDNQNYTIGLQNAQANLMQASAAKQNASSMAEWRRADIAQKQALNDLKIEEEKLNLTAKQQAAKDMQTIREINQQVATDMSKNASQYEAEKQEKLNNISLLQNQLQSQGFDTVDGAQVKISGFDSDGPILLDASGKRVIGDTQRRMMQLAGEVKQSEVNRNKTIAQYGAAKRVDQLVAERIGLVAGNNNVFREGANLEVARANKRADAQLKITEAEEKKLQHGLQTQAKLNYDDKSRTAVNGLVSSLASAFDVNIGDATDAVLATTGNGVNGEVPILAKIFGSDGTKSIDHKKINAVQKIIQNSNGNMTKAQNDLINNGYGEMALVLNSIARVNLLNMQRASIAASKM